VISIAEIVFSEHGGTTTLHSANKNIRAKERRVDQKLSHAWSLVLRTDTLSNVSVCALTTTTAPSVVKRLVAKSIH
jgi:hypothetical protein